jgi:glycerophosphoryl diester phosphodiesterase
MSSVELIAHRGHTRVAPENTLAAVRSAIEVGARNVEIDVQLSSDRLPFLFHDRTLERICGVSGGVAERTAAELSVLRASEAGRLGETFAGEPVASLAAFVELIAAHPEVHAFVELKRAALEVFGANTVVDAVAPLLAPIADRCTLISFDLAVLGSARERCDLPVGPVLEAWGDRQGEAVRSVAPDIVFCNVLRLPAEGELDVAGGRLAVYEIDSPELALHLHERGATHVETFAIGEMLRALEGAT